MQVYPEDSILVRHFAFAPNGDCFDQNRRALLLGLCTCASQPANDMYRLPKVLPRFTCIRSLVCGPWAKRSKYCMKRIEHIQLLADSAATTSLAQKGGVLYFSWVVEMDYIRNEDSIHEAK